MLTRADENLISGATQAARLDPKPYFFHGVSPAMRALERAIADIAPTNIPVLLVGESGTGKELVALEIHRLSQHVDEAFLKCSCAGLSIETLSRGMAGPDGRQGETGPSGGGTVFLDEINLLSIENQARLLQVLPDGNGAAQEHCMGGRVISSTTRNLDEEMRAGRFREELYYRINGVFLRLPPLRHRREDIAGLLEFFLKKYASLFDRPEPQLSAETLDLLHRHSWPGNVRELENAARKIVALADERLALADLAAEPIPVASESHGAQIHARAGDAGQSLKQVSREASRHAEREIILKALERTRWNRKRAARDLQISYKALLYKLKQLGLDGAAENQA